MVKSHTCHAARPAKTIALTVVFLVLLLTESLGLPESSEHCNHNRSPYPNSKQVQRLPRSIDSINELYLSSPARSNQWTPPKHLPKFTFCNLEDFFRASQLLSTIDKLISQTTSRRLIFSDQTTEQHLSPTLSSMEKSSIEVSNIIQLEYKNLQQCNAASAVLNYDEFQVRPARTPSNELTTRSIIYDK